MKATFMSSFLYLNLYITVAKSDYNSGWGGVQTTVCTDHRSQCRIPQGFLPQLAGLLDGPNLPLFK